MSEASSWWEQLEARLEQQLDAFLRANPAQESRLRDQEQQEQRQASQRHAQQRRQQAERLRAELLSLADEIRRWHERVERARAAGATDLAQRAQQHLDQLMERGRQRWQELEGLGRNLENEPAPPAGHAGKGAAQGHADNLEQSWARFETEQELETLRRSRGL